MARRAGEHAHAHWAAVCAQMATVAVLIDPIATATETPGPTQGGHQTAGPRDWPASKTEDQGSWL